MRRLLSLLVIMSLLVLAVFAQDENDEGNEGGLDFGEVGLGQGGGFGSMFRLVFQKSEEASLETERQITELVGVAREFGAGETVFAFNTPCVHYYPVGDRINVDYKGISPRVDHTKSSFGTAIKTQFEELVQNDIGNVNLQYNEIIIC